MKATPAPQSVVTFSLPLLVEQRVPPVVEPFLADQLVRVLGQQPRQSRIYAPAHGEGDFEILRWLGEGPSGVLYRARQLSLNRPVALKIFPGEPAGTSAAALPEHENLVRVYAEAYDPERRLRFLYMQYVPGLPLSVLMERLHGERPATGAELLAAIDQAIEVPLTFNAAHARERLQFEKFRFNEAMAWLGVRLAEALDFAHRHGVAHRNLKPENVLLNFCGRPYLADFAPRVGRRPRSFAASSGIYWAAEPVEIDEWAGRDDFEPGEGLADSRALCETLAAFHRALHPRRAPSRVSKRANTLPAHDWLSTTATAAAQGVTPKELRGRWQSVAELERLEAHLPRPGWLMRVSARFPLASLVLMRQFPHLMGTFVCSTYCLLRPGLPLTVPQQAVMKSLSRVYASISYPVGIAMVIALAWGLVRAYGERGRGETMDSERLERLRRRALRLPLWLAAVNTSTWLPSIPVFTAASYAITGRFHPWGFTHFSLAVLLAYMIATAYSTLYASFFAVQVLYPRFLEPRADLAAVSARELKPLVGVLRWLPLVMAAIPLLAGILLVQSVPAQISADRVRLIQLFLISLIFGGGMGFISSVLAIQKLMRFVRRLTAT